MAEDDVIGNATKHLPYPNIAKACFLVALDNGGVSRVRTQQKWQRDYRKWIGEQDGLLSEIDDYLGGLSNEELEEFCCGGADEPEVAAMRDAMAPADDLLTRYFDEVC